MSGANEAPLLAHAAHASTTTRLVIVTSAGLDAFIETDQLDHSRSGTVLAKTHSVTLTVASAIPIEDLAALLDAVAAS